MEQVLHHDRSALKDPRCFPVHILTFSPSVSILLLNKFLLDVAILATNDWISPVSHDSPGPWHRYYCQISFQDPDRLYLYDPSVRILSPSCIILDDLWNEALIHILLRVDKYKYDISWTVVSRILIAPPIIDL